MQNINIKSEAEKYVNNNFAVIPIELGTKAPKLKNWSDRTATECDIDSEFDTDKNIGVVLGANSDHLLDIDLDHPIAVQLAPYFLPETGMIFGRESNPESHWLYKVHGNTKTKKYQSPAGMVAEIRGDGVQTIFPPSIHPSNEQIRFWQDGSPATLQRDELNTAVAHLSAATLLADNWQEGNRHDISLAVAGGLLNAGWSQEDVEHFVWYIANVAEDPEIDNRVHNVEDTANKISFGKQCTGWPTLAGIIGEDNTRKIAAWTVGEGINVRSQHVETLQVQSQQSSQFLEETLNDKANGQRFAVQHKGTAIYVSDLGEWAVWDGKRYKIGDNEGIRKLAHHTANSFFQDAMQEPDRYRQDKLVSHAQKSGNSTRLDAMLKEAQPYMTEPQENFDQHAYLLNCANGVIDLCTGDLHPHSSDYRFTQYCNIEYHQDADCPVFKGFLDQIFEGDQALIDYIQKSVGYSLTGRIDEEAFFVCYGSGQNGKSTLLEALDKVFDEYGSVTPVETITNNKNQGGISNDLARLRGKRFVRASEGERNDALHESQIKRLTSGDTISARYLNKEFFEFKPCGKIWYATNHKPRISGDDPAIWRRVHLIPFRANIPNSEVDTSLPDKLNNEREGILAWAIQGAIRWYNEGALPIPEKVQAATEEYHEEMDTVGQFLDECAQEDVSVNTPKQNFYQAYQNWAQTYGYNPMNHKNFTNTLRQRGYSEKRGTGGAREWRGINLINSFDIQFDE